MDVIAVAVVTCLLAALVAWAAVRSRRRAQEADELLNELTETLDQLEGVLARVSAIDVDDEPPPAEISHQARGGIARTYTASLTGSEGGEAQDLASTFAGFIYKDFSRAFEDDETVFISGQYGPRGARLRLWHESAHVVPADEVDVLGWTDDVRDDSRLRELRGQQAVHAVLGGFRRSPRITGPSSRHYQAPVDSLH